MSKIKSEFILAKPLWILMGEKREKDEVYSKGN